ncbi:MAG: hypothetical protein C9356_11990 [Oleiphilus sp.]|nr:MAG: hypothetical protein C9356_11990 [Oleiphilus sp.]
MELLNALKACDVFDIQIGWNAETEDCRRVSAPLSDQNIFYGDTNEPEQAAIELSWGDPTHDVHSVYIAASDLEHASVEDGYCTVQGYTEEELPDFKQPMRFRLSRRVPFT